jgi:hypothetical protein
MKNFQDFLKNTKVQNIFAECQKQNAENQKYYNESGLSSHSKILKEPSDFVKLMQYTFGNGYNQTESN